MNLPNPFPGVPVKQTVVQDPNKKLPKIRRAGTNGAIIVMILDESGSMNGIRDATIEGFNGFITQQREDTQAGAVNLTFIKFEGGNIRTVYNNQPIDQVAVLDRKGYQPAGGTNLFDAIGYGMEQVSLSLRDIAKDQRPAVIFCILTDGEENSSHKYNNQDIRSMVETAESKEWTFTFLGANIDAFAVGSSFGMRMSNTVSYNVGNMGDVMASVSAGTTRMRYAKSQGLSNDEIYSSDLYTAQEREKMSK
jgi:Mg-chelatase subunit ChlD